MAPRKAGIGRRMERAALELYAERGTLQITAAEVATRAGTTERTFFRHFPDKLDVFFGDERRLRDLVADAIVDAPPELGPLQAAIVGLEAQAVEFDENSAAIRQRAVVFAAHPELQARELARTAPWIAQIEDALAQRGVSSDQVDVAAWTALYAFLIAYRRWLVDPTGAAFAGRLDDVVAQIHEQSGRR